MTAEEITAVFEHAGNLKKKGRFTEAAELLGLLAKSIPEAPIVHFRHAAMLTRAGKPTESAAVYARCLELAPEHPGAHLGLGHVLKTLGRYEESIRSYKRCIELRPDQGEVYFSLANLKTYRFDDSLIEDMQQRVASETIRDTSKINFLFALGKAFEDRKDYDSAWTYYTRGNKAQRMNVHYDPVRTEATANELIRHFSAEFFERTAGGGLSDASPIFILGLPRSGSTLIEQILDCHSAVEGTGELPYIKRLTRTFSNKAKRTLQYPAVLRRLDSRKLMLLGARYLELAARHRSDKTLRFVDKTPENFLYVGFIQSILPNAKIIDARRHPLDTCVSNLKQLYSRGQNYCYDQTEIGEYYLQYQRVMDHWDDVLPGRVLRVQYEDVVGNLEVQIKRILDYLELPWEDQCLRFYDNTRAVHSASSEQVRLPVYSGSIGVWSHFNNQLDELKTVLEPILNRYT